MENKNIRFYKNLKKEFQKDINFVGGAKSKMFDFVVYGLNKDSFIKIVKPNEIKFIESYKGYMFGKFEKTLTKKEYVLVYVNEEFMEIGRDKVKLN